MTGLEPATSGVTGRRSNQLSYTPARTCGAKALIQNRNSSIFLVIEPFFFERFFTKRKEKKMTVSVLNAKRVSNAKPRGVQYVIWDNNPRGLGLCVGPSGRKRFVLQFTRSGRRHYESLGDASSLRLKEARRTAKERIGAITAMNQVGPNSPFEVLAELAMMRMERLWKPGTREVNRIYLKSTILPYFKGREIASITRRDVEEWFAGLHHKQGAANRAKPVLSVIMREAEEVGARPEDSNPVEGLRKYRRPRKERVLTPGEMARLGSVLDTWEDRYPRKTAMLRLIILTGCRKGEIQNLHWRDYRDGHLRLTDSKTGPKTVFLSSHARDVLEKVNSPRSGPVFPPQRRNSRIPNLEHFWIDLRKEVGLEDVRLHDLRHNFASAGIRQKVNLSVLGVLLGHRDYTSTLRYTHLDDSTLLEAVSAVGRALASCDEGDSK